MSRIPVANALAISGANPFSEESKADAHAHIKIDVTSPHYWEFDFIPHGLYTQEFDRAGPENGKLSGSNAKTALLESGLPKEELAQIWRLSDLGQDGRLDMNEFTIAMHLVNWRKAGGDLPQQLPLTMIPTGNRSAAPTF
jgi:hypothetical protein